MSKWLCNVFKFSWWQMPPPLIARLSWIIRSPWWDWIHKFVLACGASKEGDILEECYLSSQENYSSWSHGSVTCAYRKYQQTFHKFCSLKYPLLTGFVRYSFRILKTPYVVLTNIKRTETKIFWNVTFPSIEYQIGLHYIYSIVAEFPSIVNVGN